MNRTLYEYCLGSAARRRPSSEHGRHIQSLIVGASDDAALLRAIQVALADVAALDEDVFRLLKPLHGCGGSEGYVLDVEPAEEAAFWTALAGKFPQHQGICYVAADAALLAGHRTAASKLFIRGFRLNPNECFPFAVDADELLSGTGWQLEYRLHLLAQTRVDYPDELAEQVAELVNQYGNSPDAVKLINDVANGGGVPELPEHF